MTLETNSQGLDLRALGGSELQERQSALVERFRDYRSRSVNIDMTRGKPSPEQLDLALDMLHCVDGTSYSINGVDCRNYGGLDGLPEVKALFAQFLEVEPDEIIIGDNSSLAMMYDAINRAMTHGLVDSERPWGQLPKVRFLCPCPGYDRHFTICEHLGIELIPIEMRTDGPDLDSVARLAAEDESVKGIWCVPKYSNPTGVTYSDSVVDRLASMETAAADFRIFWDNAYTVHHLTDRPDRLKNGLTACKQAGNPDRIFMFGSTSKISFAGSGLALLAGSRNNIAFTKKQLAFRTIGPDKLNQLRHLRFFQNIAGIEAHMAKHAEILRPKFEAVLVSLDQELGGKGIAEWSQPTGGYFVNLNVMDGCARAVVDMAAEAGVKLTPAGSTFPYGQDPRDRNIRIAPSFPPVADIQTAMGVVGTCIELAAIDKLLGKA